MKTQGPSVIPQNIVILLLKFLAVAYFVVEGNAIFYIMPIASVSQSMIRDNYITL